MLVFGGFLFFLGIYLQMTKMLVFAFTLMFTVVQRDLSANDQNISVWRFFDFL